MQIPKWLRYLALAAALVVAVGTRSYSSDGVMKDPKASWNKIFDNPGYIFGTEPIPFLVDNLDLIPPQGRALELAMGEGRNAVYLAQKGFKVTGVDISEVAAKKCKSLAARRKVDVEVVIADLRDYKIQPNTYDLITNFYFPQPDLIPKIKEALKPGGFFMYEQWRPYRGGLGFPGGSSGAGSGGDVYQYSDVGRDELLNQFRDYRVHLYREAIVNHAITGTPGRGLLMSEVISLIAQKPFD
ncbi:MAG: class I SAM-dependent methyltransferase [Thermoanaerobaculia bacterium]